MSKAGNVKITNKQSGKNFMVTEDDAAAILNNVHTKGLYTVESKAELPELSSKIKGSGTPESTDVK